MSQHNHSINKTIQVIIAGGHMIEDQGHQFNYVGVSIKQMDKNMIALSQPALLILLSLI